MSFGKPMLIENIEEELDPMLDPVLEKRLIKKGKSFIMPMADKEASLSWQPFTMHMSTAVALASCHTYLHETCRGDCIPAYPGTVDVWVSALLSPALPMALHTE